MNLLMGGFDPEEQRWNADLSDYDRERESMLCDHHYDRIPLLTPDGERIPGRWYRCTRCGEAGYEVPDDV